ncbi:MAG: glycosyltransferase [Rhodospirillales bacterium]|nr:glycosyltransferase [Rhodospirillales bacterium]
MTLPALSVCVCTHDREEDVRACLAGLRAQTVAPERLEVLLVDSASPPAAAAALAALAALHPGARLVRLDEAGLSRARNAGAGTARAPWIAYLDDDAVPAPDWAAAALAAIAAAPPGTALIGGRILPDWEAPLPAWWPPSLRGTLSIVEHPASGEYGAPGMPPGLAPCGANLLVERGALRAVGGFDPTIGRLGTALLSDEEVHLAHRLRAAGFRLRYAADATVRHRIRAARLTPSWLLTRLYWQGISAVRTRRLLGQHWQVWREVPRRAAVVLLCAPFALAGQDGTAWLPARWRLAYAWGFVGAALGRRPDGHPSRRAARG